MNIDTTSPLIQKNLKRIADIIVEHGGEINTGATVHHQNQQLWISCEKNATDKPLFVVPNELFVPVSDLIWHGHNGVLDYEGSTSQLTGVQQELLAAMLIIYNESGKVLGIAENLPSVQLKHDDELLLWVQTAHPTFKLPTENSATQFIGTRLNEVSSNSDPYTKIGCLMPLIDYMNHHPFGASYERTADLAWCVLPVHTISGSNECFLRYTNTDAHSIAFWHGYCETNTMHIASVQCQFQHAKVGTINIRSTNAKRRLVNAPRFMPNESDLCFQDLALERRQLPALRTLIGLAIRTKLKHLSQTDAENMAIEIIQLIIEANIKKYSELQVLCSTSIESTPLRSLFGQVAKHQLALLRNMRTN